MRSCAISIARTTACWLAALALLLVPMETARSQDPRDRGIGGTGVVSSDPESDRGIGGTGMMGTIRGFGSIIVNGLHVTYAPDVPVRIDGQPRAVSDLRIGQVVRVVAETQNGVLRTRQIDVTSEVVGTIEATGSKTLRVLGQSVSIESLNNTQQWRRGERVAVFGLRRPDGTIVASLIERRAEGPEKVIGSVIKLRDGSLGIGQLKLSGVAPALVGTRAVLEGAYKSGVLDVIRTAKERDLLGPEIRRFSIEAYVERTRNGLRLGSDLEVAGKVPSALPAGSYAPAVVTLVADQRGRLGLERVSLEGPPVRSTGSSQGPNTRSAPSTPAGTQGRKAPPHDRDLGPAQSPRGESRSGTGRGRSDSNDSPGNSGNSRGDSAGGSGGNSGGNGGGHGGSGNGGGNGGGNGNGNGGGGGRR
ncbi:DUF5666 domain-containing protein [Microvirga sp. G4-2]|uniref:DUF5666 domain-containing protein n=1 Tax=Microvirga sp. G4-2 TaxID=3434467 RepID=UPI004044ACA7